MILKVGIHKKDSAVKTDVQAFLNRQFDVLECLSVLEIKRSCTVLHLSIASL